MDIDLNRRGGVPLREQLVAQLELQILSGGLAAGQRLPSVRALARRLKLHHNTVSAAYQDLEAAGHVELRRGAGVFVRRADRGGLAEAGGLDEMIRLVLEAALKKGFSGAQIRVAVERWLASAPPNRVVVVDPVRETARLLAAELGTALGVPAAACSVEDVRRDARGLAGALAVVLPYHLDALRRAAPGAAIEVVTLEVQAPDRQLALSLRPGTIVLVVSDVPAVLSFASMFLRSLRGDELLVEARPLSAEEEWRRLVRAADLVVADVLCSAAVAKARPRRLHELRLVPESAVARVRQALGTFAP